MRAKPILLALANLSAPPEAGKTIMGLHMAQAAPDDRLLKQIVGRGLTRLEAMENLIEELDGVAAQIMAIRELTMSMIQDELENPQ